MRSSDTDPLIKAIVDVGLRPGLGPSVRHDLLLREEDCMKRPWFVQTCVWMKQKLKRILRSQDQE